MKANRAVARAMTDAQLSLGITELARVTRGNQSLLAAMRQEVRRRRKAKRSAGHG